MSYLDVLPPIDFQQFSWLLKAGVPMEVLIGLTPIKAASGTVSAGRFYEGDGDRFLVSDEEEDRVFWSPRTGQIGTELGIAFALGEAAITNPGTYSFDNHLRLFADPLDWLRNRCDGAVVLDWSRAFDRLRDCPRIAVAEELLFLYRRHMQPPRMPETFVIPRNREVAA